MSQASNLKENQFLDLLDNDNNIIELSYVKEGLWLKAFDHSNSLCMHATRAIMNHTPIGEYCYGTLWTLTIFILFYFILSDFIWILFFFYFYFSFE